MTVVELKKKLIEQIQNTDDEEVLEHISDIFKFELNTKSVHKLSNEEKAAVEDGRNQIKNGQWLSDEDANKQIDEWLKE